LGVAFWMAATHFVKSGGSGTTAGCPGEDCAEDREAIPTQWLKVSLEIDASPIFATVSPEAPPHAVSTATDTKKAPSAKRIRSMRATRVRHASEDKLNSR